MIRVLSLLASFTLILSIPSLFAGDGFIGENPGLNFYSRIDANAGDIVTSLVRKRLKEYSTFAGFGRQCRSSAPWIDSERMDGRILDALMQGNYSALSNIASRKKVTINSESLENLVNCFTDTYIEMQKGALRDFGAISHAGNMGLYMDGNTSNSEYDIMNDIEKINSLIFSETLTYNGTANGGKGSIDNLLAGKIIGPLITPLIRTELGGGETGTPTLPIDPNNGGGGEIGSGKTLKNLGIGETCSENNTPIDVSNMVDDSFLDELSLALHGNDPDLSGGGGSYDPSELYGNTSQSNAQNIASLTSKGDFFHKPRCESIFCITVQMVNGSENFLMGGKNTSIESIIDKYSALLEPISTLDNGTQKMTNNTVQIPFTSISLQLKNKVKGGGVFMTQNVTPKERYKSDETKNRKDEKFAESYRCAMYSAGFSDTDPARINGAGGAGYVTTLGSTTENQANTTRPLGVINPDSQSLAGCMSLSVNRAQDTYYQSFSDDLSEMLIFTNSLIGEVQDFMQVGTEKIKKLKPLP